jgi:hypothetical protein
VAAAADGTVTGAAIGFATVTATSNGRTGRAVVHVGSAAGDGVPPTVRAFSFSPARVDADGADSVTVRVRVTDPGAGVGSVAVAFGSPTAETGTWEVSYLQAYDQVSNGITLTRADPESAGFPATLAVTP